MEEFSASLRDTQPGSVESNAHRHTPGPWYVRDMRASYMASLGWTGPSIDTILITNKTGAEIVESAGEDCVVARISFDNRLESLGESNLADARLIAASPTMLDALLEAEAGLEFAGADVDVAVGAFVPTPTLALRAVRAAISHATTAASDKLGGDEGEAGVNP